MPQINCPKLGKKFEVKEGKNLMQSLVDEGLPVGSSCGGAGVCTKCLIKVIAGDDHLSRPNDIEKKLVKREKIDSTYRVSCQVEVYGDITVTADYW
jgi:2Fe-2S ferredoxin